MLPTRLLRRYLGPPYKLSTSMLVAASLVVTVLTGLYSALAYERLGRETMESARHWSESVANLAASNNTSAMVLNDVAAMESNLQQVAQLPGIVNMALFRGDGRPLVSVTNTGSQIQSRIGEGAPIALPASGEKKKDSHVVGNVYEAWSVIDAGSPTPLGWVRVQFSLQERSQELDRLWRQSALATVVLVTLVLISLHFIMSWALRPIRVLSKFAQNMSRRVGSQIAIAPTCLEAIQLGDALNETSQGIAEQVARVNAIVNTAAEAIIGLDANGLIALSNPATSSMFGRPQSELMGHSIELCVPGLTTEALRSMVSDSAGGSNRVVRQDLHGQRADGTPFPVEISLGTVHDNKGLQYACIVRDTTDERAAQETSELYERALACSHNAVFIMNARRENQPIVYINDAFKKIINLPPYKVLGGTIDILRGEEEQGSEDPSFLELQRAVMEQRVTSVTLTKSLPNGKKETSEVSLSPVLSDSGVLTHFVGILSDVSARVHAEEAIAERGAQLDAIFSLSPDGFVLFDAQDRLVFANPAFERMTGLNWLGQAQTISLDLFETIIGDICDEKHPIPSLMYATHGGEPWEARLQLVRPHSRVVHAQSRGNVAGRGETILYFRDITHEDAVDRMKSEFLAAAAHELRTPMVSIFGFTELLLRRKYSEERQADMLQTIHKQSGLLVKMINELLDLARIESRRGLDLDIKPHPLSELIDNSVKGLMRAEGDRQVMVGEIPAVNVLMDPEKMQLAMTNLLSNAFKYSPQGGNVTLHARVETRGHEQYAVLAVKDQGIGMKPEQVARAFERFYRADASGNIPGTGLGLSLVKEIAELHKGRVELASEYGSGTTASLWIPLAKAELALSAAA
jgi:PAS domain S-box-containing protein